MLFARSTLLTLALMLAGPVAGAAGTQFIVTPNGSSDPNAPCNATTPCSLDNAVANKGGTQGDVIMLQGGPFTTAGNLVARDNTLIEGGFLTEIDSTGTGTALTIGSGGELANVLLRAPNGFGVRLSRGGATLSGVVPSLDHSEVRAKLDACAAGDNGSTSTVLVLITNSLCDSATGTGLYATYSSATSVSLTAYSSTLVGQNDGQALYFSDSSMTGGALTLTNTIAYRRSNNGSPCSVNVNNATVFNAGHSDFTTSTGGACGNSSLSFDNANQTTTPTFVNDVPDLVAGDYRETAASTPTIGGGTATGASATDLKGNPRVGEDGKIDIGAYQYFPPPTITPKPVTAITATSATLNALVDGHGPETSNSFVFGTDTTYSGSPLPDAVNTTGFGDMPVSTTLMNLQPHTTYHYKLAALVPSGAPGSNVAGSPDATFTTSPLPPAIGVQGASAVTSSGATLSAAVNPEGVGATVHFEYGTTTAYGSHTSNQSITAAGTVTAVLPPLAAGTLYHARAVATNAGGTTDGPDFTFTTAGHPTPGAGVRIVRASVAKDGTITLRLLPTRAGTLTAAGSFTVPGRRSHRNRHPKPRMFSYGARASGAAGGASVLTLTLKPSPNAVSRLKRGSVKVLVRVTFTAVGGGVASANTTVKVPRRKPARPRRH